MAKLNDADFGAKLVAAYRAYRDLHEAGALDSDAEHPRDTVNNWISTIRDCKAQDDGGSPLGESGTMKRTGRDDEQPEKTASGNSGSGGPMPAQDGRYTVGTDGVPRFEAINAKGETVAILTGDAALSARARQSNPTRAARMASRIKGYDARK